MKILVEQFCALSTSPSWQSWLYHFDQGLHSRYINRLRQSTGCNSNREIMKEALEEVQELGGGDDLVKFLQKHFPQVIKSDVPVEMRVDINEHKIFASYTPGILTYPRRIILSGTARELRQKVREFILDKPVHDSIIVGERAYIEYLEERDLHLKDSIPMKNWQIATYRNKNSI